MSVIAWNSINLLHNAITYFDHVHDVTGNDRPEVTYRAKVKQHGMNCAVQRTAVGLVFQSRTTILTPQQDLKGFAKWADAESAYFLRLPQDVVVFGEWCGPGVEKGMAISQVANKVFAIFGLHVQGKMVADPNEIDIILGKDGRPKDLHILPWVGGTTSCDFEGKSFPTDGLNTWVAQVEKEDPWVLATFGISGLGEGLVYYPVHISNQDVPTDPEQYAHFMFKAKGEKHRTVAAPQAVQVSATIVEGVDAFVDLVVTEARLEQGASSVGGRDPKLTGKFIQWVTTDTQKETVDELAASGLSWDQVKSAVSAKARAWYLQR